MSDAAVADAAAQPKKKSKLPLILIALVVVAGGAGGAWFFMGKGGEGAEGEAQAKAAPPAPAIYVSYDPPFVVNFESSGSVRFLQVAIQVMTRDAHVAEMLKQHDPVIRNDLLLLLGNQKHEVISTREGKEALQQEALAAVRKVIETNAGDPAKVESVLFTSFVMQ